MNPSVNSLTTGAERLEWTVRLADGDDRKRWGVFAAAILAGMAGLTIFRSPVIGGIAAMAILFSTADFWLGTKFVLTETSATSRCGLSVSSMEWSSVRRVIEENDLIILSPLEEESRLSEFRGVRLRIRDEKAEVVRQFIKARCGEHARFLG